MTSPFTDERDRIEQALTFDTGCEPSAQEIIDALNRAGFQITPQAGEEAAVDKYVDDYVFEHDEGYYTPTTAERTLIKDAIMGFLPLLDDAAADRTAPPQAGEANVNDLAALRVRLKTGEYDGTDIMAAWIAIDELIALRTAPPPPVCPHLRSSDEGTQWCDLAVAPVWQAIATAPMSGEPILLAKIAAVEAVPEFKICARPPYVWWACKGSWSHQYARWWDGIEPSGLAGPTHWYPMLKLPPDSPGAPDEVEDAGAEVDRQSMEYAAGGLKPWRRGET